MGASLRIWVGIYHPMYIHFAFKIENLCSGKGQCTVSDDGDENALKAG